MNTTNIILIATNIPIVLVALYSALIYKKLEKELRLFSWFLFLSFFIQIPSMILYIFGINNMPLLHIYTLVGGVLIILFYKEVLQSYLSGKILLWAAGVYALFILINSLFLEAILTFNTNGLIVEAAVVVILALSTFNLLLQQKELFKNKAMYKSINWINSGFFIYFCSNLLLYYFGDYLVRSSISILDFRHIWLLHSLFTITLYICFFFGLWKSPKH